MFNAVVKTAAAVLMLAMAYVLWEVGQDFAESRKRAAEWQEKVVGACAPAYLPKRK